MTRIFADFFILFLLIFLLYNSLFAQELNRFPALSNYSKWSIVAGPALYSKAKLYPQYGDYTFDNKLIWSFNAGIEYDLIPDGKWSFTTGILMGFEPVYNIRYRIKEEDIYPEYTEDCTGDAKMYANPSFSFPLLARLNIQVNDKTFAYFTAGLRALYFPSGEAEFTLRLSSPELDESREVFGIRLYSPENELQGSFVIGTGIMLPVKRILLKSSLKYTINFQNIIEGEYLFDNLFVSPDSRGEYELSGNYLALMVSLSFSRRNN